MLRKLKLSGDLLPEARDTSHPNRNLVDSGLWSHRTGTNCALHARAIPIIDWAHSICMVTSDNIYKPIACMIHAVQGSSNANCDSRKNTVALCCLLRRGIGVFKGQNNLPQRHCYQIYQRLETFMGKSLASRAASKLWRMILAPSVVFVCCALLSKGMLTNG